MQKGDAFEVRGTIKQLGEWHMPVAAPDENGMVQGPRRVPKRELDPNTIALEFEVDGLSNSRCYLLVRKDEVKRLNLTVGDKISITVAASE